ncbi:hypothetical protein [Streptomyces sp. NPDC056165]|uniref:hypothetical protein n=1 Tax=Streptomyces sp. NPDC056165 TaxID=3345733 RepID=UPI0035DFB51A
MTAPVRASDLEVLVPSGWHLETDPDVVRRYEDAPDLPGPIQAVGPMDGPVTTAWYPRCSATVPTIEQDFLLATDRYAILNGQVTVDAHRRVASLISLGGCGHAFRVLPGQTIAEVREPVA